MQDRMKYIGQIWQVRLGGIVGKGAREQTRGAKVKAGGAGGQVKARRCGM
jgi:hypothetical protein